MNDQVRGWVSRARDLGSLVLSRNYRKVWRALYYRIYSESTSLGLRRDLSVPFTAPEAKIPLSVRPLVSGDDLSSLDYEPGLSGDEAFSRLTQRRLLRSGLRICHVAIARDEKLCYMQWLIPPEENDRLRRMFGNLYPVLGRDEALLEGAYTPVAFRGKGIMGAAMAQVAGRATELGTRWVITFCDEVNEASVKGCIRAGFTPYLRRREKFRLFHRYIAFELVEPEHLKPSRSPLPGK